MRPIVRDDLSSWLESIYFSGRNTVSYNIFSLVRAAVDLSLSVGFHLGVRKEPEIIHGRFLMRSFESADDSSEGLKVVGPLFDGSCFMACGRESVLGGSYSESYWDQPKKFYLFLQKILTLYIIGSRTFKNHCPLLK